MLYATIICAILTAHIIAAVASPFVVLAGCVARLVKSTRRKKGK